MRPVPIDIRPRHSARGGVVLLPPESIWPALDALREKHDPQIVRWMPHVRLLFPFVAPERFPEVLPTLQAVCERVRPFQAVLSTVAHAPLANGKGALFVPLEPPDEIGALRAALRAAFPEVTSSRTSPPDALPPHVSLGQARTPRIAEHLAEEAAATWEPVTVTFAAVCLVGRQGGEPMRVAQEVPLGG